MHMPQEYGGNCTFNISDLSLFYERMNDLNLRTNSLQEGESNMDQGGQDTPAKNMGQTSRESLQGPLTKGRLKKLETEVKKNMDLLRRKGASKEEWPHKVGRTFKPFFGE
ncbi:hypothetical protein CR513_00509, partial [Mucuna pruriens]